MVKKIVHTMGAQNVDNHKMKWMHSALKFLMHYAQEGDEFLDSIVIVDETWVFHHTAEPKQQSLQWRHMPYVIQRAESRLL
jgi:hypothetical protein